MLKDFALSNGKLSPAPVGGGPFTFKDPGGIPVVSANGAKDGIVWIVISKGWRDTGRSTFGILQAYDAADISRMIYSSSTNIGRDGAGPVLRFTMPTVAGGRVYIGVRSALYVYGPLKR